MHIFHINVFKNTLVEVEVLKKYKELNVPKGQGSSSWKLFLCKTEPPSATVM